jgi:hypothetical protein
LEPIQGKTYSLYGQSNTSDDYFKVIKQLADLCLRKFPGYDEKQFLSQLKKVKKNIKETLKIQLGTYTQGVKAHLKRLSPWGWFDSTLRTTEAKYHLYMLQIELVNRVYKDAFKNSKYKFALLPHCLRDFRLKCLSSPGDIEHICKGCTKECYIHQGSKILKKSGIDPYISVTMDQDTLLREIKNKHYSVGVLGIACIPELARGMKLAIRLGIPPIGVPLDANRCDRWMGKAKESSFNLKELEDLVK